MSRIHARLLCCLASLAFVVACGDQKPTENPGAGAAPATDAPAADAPGAGGMEHPDAAALDGKPVVANGDAKVGDVTNCPVSGEKFVVSDASPKLDHNGKTYYFCCEGCLGKATAEPDKFLAASE